MPCLRPLGPGLVLRDLVVEIASGNFSYFVLGTHDHRKLFGVMFLSPGPISNECSEKAGESERLVRTGGFEMAPEGFTSHIDAVDRLRIGAGRRRHSTACASRNDLDLT